MTDKQDLQALRRRFNTEMIRGVNELAQLGYNASIFRRMLADHGAVEAARRLALDPTPSEGLWHLQRMHKLEMSVEMWVLLPWYEPLFAPDVRERAEGKLRLLNVKMPDELNRLARRLQEVDDENTATAGE